MPKLWTEQDGEAWIDNPRRRRRGKGRKARKHRAHSNRKRARRPPPAGFASWKAYMAHIRGMRKGGSVARRSGRSNPRHHRRHRRNPPGFLRSITGRLVPRAKRAAMGAGGVVLGEIVSGGVPGLVKQDKTKPLGMAIGALVTILTAPLVQRFAGPDIGAGYAFGGLAVPMKSLVMKANIAPVNAALSAYSDVRAIPLSPSRSLAAPQGMPGFTYDEEEVFLVQ